eukprot:1009188-Rhodomonas_salina.5
MQCTDVAYGTTRGVCCPSAIRSTGRWDMVQMAIAAPLHNQTNATSAATLRHQMRAATFLVPIVLKRRPIVSVSGREGFREMPTPTQIPTWHTSDIKVSQIRAYAYSRICLMAGHTRMSYSYGFQLGGTVRRCQY